MTRPFPNPADLRVIYRRDACGAVESLEIWRGEPNNDASEMLLDTSACEMPDAALQDVLWGARDYYKADPSDDTLPPDHAVIEMYMDNIA